MAASSYELKIHSKGVRELLRSKEIEGALMAVGERIAAAAGPGHEASSWQGFDRVHVSVRTTTIEAILAEKKDRNLSRAIQAGRGA